MSAGSMRERLTVQRNDPPTLSVSSLTRANTTATATTTTPHGYAATDYVTIIGAAQAYNGKVKIVAVPTSTSFTFTCNGTLVTTATGTITVVYTSNAQGGQGLNFWRTVDTIAAEMIPLKADERLQLAAMQSDTTYRFRVRIRPDLAVTMRLLWTPRWPPAVGQKTLAITGVIEADADLTYQFIEAAVAA